MLQLSSFYLSNLATGEAGLSAGITQTPEGVSLGSHQLVSELAIGKIFCLLLVPQLFIAVDLYFGNRISARITVIPAAFSVVVISANKTAVSFKFAFDVFEINREFGVFQDCVSLASGFAVASKEEARKFNRVHKFLSCHLSIFRIAKPSRRVSRFVSLTCNYFSVRTYAMQAPF